VFASPELRVLPHRQVSVPDDVYAAASDHRPTWVDLELT
jgi:endonuclease/exonuclease/phosphatase family metal-dependent hydrolase